MAWCVPFAAWKSTCANIMIPSLTEKLAPVQLDWNGFLSNLRREGTPERVYYFEHGVAENV